LPALYRDDVIAAALPFVKGDDRTVLIGALGSSQGATGADLLHQVFGERGSGTGHDRAVALSGLRFRIGAEGTPLYAAALTDRSVPVQLSAILALAQFGDARATTPVIAWLTRKLRRNNRLATCDPWEVPAPITFAVRNECVQQVAVVLVSNLSRLDPTEREWLALVWPDLESRGVGSDPSPPDPVGLDKWLYESATRPEDYAASQRFTDTYVQAALARAHRRARRVEGT